MGKYYRFMKDAGPKESLPEIKGVVVSRYRQGDYLEPFLGGMSFCHLRLTEQALLADLHEDVQGMVSSVDFQKFLRDGTVVEVPQNVRELDLKYQTEIYHLVLHCDRAYDSLHRAELWGEDLQTIAKLRKNYDVLREELDRVRDRLNEKVIKPLCELNQRKPEGLDGVLADARERAGCVGTCDGLSKDEIGKE